MAEGLTSQEREGLLLLDRDKFIRWGDLKTRTFEVIGFQHKLLAEASERFGLNNH